MVARLVVASFVVLIALDPLPLRGQAKAEAQMADEVTYKAKQAGVSLTLVVPKRIVAGASITLNCIIKNESDQSVVYRSSLRDTEIKMIDASGNKVPVTRFGSRNIPTIRISSGRTKEILPGERITVTVPLTRLYDLSIADTYMLRIGVQIRVGQVAYGLSPGEVKLNVEEPKE